MALGRTARLDLLLSPMVAGLEGASPGRFEAELCRWLRRIGEAVGAEQCFVERLNGSQGEVVVHAAQRRRRAHAAVLGDASLTWTNRQLRRGRVVQFAQASDVPAAAHSDHRGFERRGIRSCFLSPMTDDGRFIGVVGLIESRRVTRWSSELLRKLSLVSQLLAAAVARHDAKARYRVLQDQLLHASRMGMLSEVSASLAHELTQPLAAILSNAQAALRFLAMPEVSLTEIQAIFSDIIRDDKRAASVISGLRNLVRRQGQSRERVHVATALEEVMNLLHSEFLSRSVVTAADLDVECFVNGDKGQIQQVALNLVMNALQAMQEMPEGRRLEVSARASVKGEVLVIFRDTGPGLDPATVARAFDPFYTTKKQGLGIGLAISRALVVTHGGTIWCDNHPEGGALFSFSLPTCQ